MPLAAIDCGTNSIRLLIADVQQSEAGVKLRDCERLMKVVRLGEGVDATGRFSEAALERTFAAAREYAQLLQKYGVSTLRFGATSATRDASNRQVFISGIEQILGVRPEVISGPEEAALSFAGAVSALGNTAEDTLVVDLGGGSTEFVLGNQDGVKSAVSMNIGCVRLTERYAVSSPMSQQERENILGDVDAALDEAAQSVDFSKAQRLVGVAGTVTTVVAQAKHLASYDAQVINGSELTLEQVQVAAEELAAMSAEQRMQLGFMHEGRKDVIGTGALIWSRIVERIAAESGGKISSVLASEFDILDGLVLSQLA